MIFITLQELIDQRRADDPTFTITKMADDLAMPRNTLYRYINGTNKTIDREVLDNICRYLDIPPGPVPFIRYSP